jgi:S1-C subfamily serine protease
VEPKLRLCFPRQGAVGSISGGYALTITDGIVSSLLPDEGYIITSAKISHGNSGGLAVDENGCQIGIPAMVSSDDSESLGVIISNNLIEEFTSEVHTYLDNN